LQFRIIIIIVTHRVVDLRPQKFKFFCDPILFAICSSKIINK
jgi:hypothetical protein